MRLALGRVRGERELTGLGCSRNLGLHGDGVPPELPSKLMTPAMCVNARKRECYPPRDG